MMLGERSHHLSPTIQVPPWPVDDDLASLVTGAMPYTQPLPGGSPGGGELSPYVLGDASLAALHRFLPSNDLYSSDDADDSDLSQTPVDAYSCDEFRMYEFKVRRCLRGRSHDWTECPYAHPGEKARRRDPRKYHYSGTSCPDFRKGSCKRGDSCEFAHGVFECWLHPARYRTQPCKDGINCRRRVCFFAHTPEQLRVLPHSSSAAPQQSPRAPAGTDSYDGSPLRQQHQLHHPSADAYFASTLLSSSPTSTLISPPLSPPSDSPPLSPSGSSIRRASLPSGSTVNELLVSFRQLQLSKANSAPTSWGLQHSPRGLGFAGGAAGFSSLPSTPSRMSMMSPSGVSGGVSGSWRLDGWEEPMERVESGRDLRAKIAEKLSKENPLEVPENGSGAASSMGAPDVDWVSDLVQ